jgi:hypothetical protein
MVGRPGTGIFGHVTACCLRGDSGRQQSPKHDNRNARQVILDYGRSARARALAVSLQCAADRHWISGILLWSFSIRSLRFWSPF